MIRPLPVTRADWEQYLRGYSADVLTDATDDELQRYTAEQRERRWLGTAPATDDEITAEESRLGLQLPPGLRTFLSLSNGWSHIGPFVYELLPVQRLDLLPRTDQAWLLDCTFEDDPLLPVLHRGLLLSGEADSGEVVADPQDVGPDGEWAIWWRFSWAGDFGTRHPSFAAYVTSERASFESLRAGDGRPVRPDELDQQVETARTLLWHGHLSNGERHLADAADRGSTRARVLMATLHALQGQWWHSSPLADVFREPPDDDADLAAVETDVIPLYLYAIRNQRRQDPQIALHAGTARSQGPHGARLATSLEQQDAGHPPRATPSDPLLDAALDRCRATADVEDARQLLRQAVQRWQPTSGYQLVPLRLLTDPALHRLITPDTLAGVLTRRPPSGRPTDG